MLINSKQKQEWSQNLKNYEKSKKQNYEFIPAEIKTHKEIKQKEYEFNTLLNRMRNSEEEKKI